MKYFLIAMILAAAVTFATEADNSFIGAVEIVHTINGFHGK